jgi:cell division protein FtsB
MPARSGDIGVPGERRSSRSAGRRSSQAARRRWLMLFAVVAVVVVAFLVNIGPLTHYQDARARLLKATGKVDTLKTQRADLQAQLGKLSEAGYLETLAREQLAYVRPGEELYIVTRPAGDTAGAATGAVAAPGIGAGFAGDLGSGAAAVQPDGAEAAGSSTSQTGAAQPPGFLERIISAIRGLF